MYGGSVAAGVAKELLDCDYCHPVPAYTFGKFGTVAYNQFGTVAYNQRRAELWRGAFITKPVGEYGYSGWIWETVDGALPDQAGAKVAEHGNVTVAST